jgi:hypothetical protein
VIVLNLPIKKGLVILKYANDLTGIIVEVTKIRGFERGRAFILPPQFDMCPEYVEKSSQL